MDHPNPDYKFSYVEQSDLAFTIVFTVELVLKVIALGFVLHPYRCDPICHPLTFVSRCVAPNNAMSLLYI